MENDEFLLAKKLFFLVLVYEEILTRLMRSEKANASFFPNNYFLVRRRSQMKQPNGGKSKIKQFFNLTIDVTC